MAEIDLLNYDKRKLFEQIDQLSAFRYYLSLPVEVGRKFSNPFRKDPEPSASLKWMNSGDLVMVDFGDGKFNGDLITMLRKSRNLSYKQAYYTLYKDFNHFISRSYEHIKQPKRINTKKPISIEIIEQPYTYKDLWYWSSYGINLQTLRRGKVFSCSKVLIGDDNVIEYTDDSPLYAYLIVKGIYKIYRPFGKKVDKFRFNGSADQAIQGLDLLPSEGELLIITKSWKDCLFLIQRGYNAICTQGEGMNLNEDLIKNLKSRFKKVIIFYDRDKQGLRTTWNLWRKYSLDWRFIPKYFNKKDITDYYYFNNEEKTNELIWRLFGMPTQKME